MINKKRFINNRRIAVLLSTYNGSRYLSQLLDSLLNQSYTNYTIYIRDDKSSDETLSILSEYASKNDNIILIESDCNLGSKRSFLQLLEYVKSELYMFCDQDDVWLINKIEVSVNEYEKVRELHTNKPIVIHTDLKLVDGNLKVISDSYWKYCGIPVDMPHQYELFCHFGDVTGCTMLFNSKARDCVLPYIYIKLPRNIYHDYLVALLTVRNNGVIVPLHQSLILFRRHGDNETNPLSREKSVLTQIYKIVPYIKDQRKRCQFYNTFMKQSFVVFLYYKFKTKKLHSIWKKKQEL